VTREERDHLRIRIDAEVRRRRLPDIRANVEKGDGKRRVRQPAKYARAA
jgi:hypothetical protein